jgi:diacylglycerol kinase family enzyme
VIKLLKALEISFDVHTTSAPRDAGSIGIKILQTLPEGADVTVITAGGDGTAHELIEGLVQSGKSYGRWNLVILPLGTVSRMPDFALTARRMPFMRRFSLLLPNLLS